MATYDFDLFTIGAGSGGVSSSRRAGSYGAKVAICEESRVGGTCVIRGCVPKKLLMYGARFAHDLDDAAGFGWSIPERAIAWPALIAAKNKEIDRLNGIYLRLLRDAGVSLIEGRATLVDPHTVEVAGRRYTARYILVATGSAPILPRGVRGIEHAITSNEALDLPALPKRLAVVGGGYIGVELACIFNALGTKVTMIIRGDTVLRGFDDDVRASLTNEMRKQGIEIRCETFVSDIERRGGALDLLTHAGDTLACDAVLYATGRAPSTRGIGLEEVGVTLDAAGAVVVNGLSRSSVESVYAVGDCTNRFNLTPVAIAEGRAVAETLFNGRPTEVSHTGVPTAVFSMPPVGAVGMSEHAARAAYGDADIYVSSFRPLKHTLSGRDERTMMKLVVAPGTGVVLGVHIVGEDAPEIIQGFAVALKCGAKKADLDATIGIHPSAAEELVTMRDKRAPRPAT